MPFWCWYHLKRAVDYKSPIQPSKFCIGKMMLYWPYSLLHAMKILLSSILPSLLKFLPFHINDIHTCFRVRLTVILESIYIISNTWKVLFFKYWKYYKHFLESLLNAFLITSRWQSSFIYGKTKNEGNWIIVEKKHSVPTSILLIYIIPLSLSMKEFFIWIHPSI